MKDIEKKIEINVITEFMPSHSSDEEKKYYFAYSVTIQNHSQINIQIITRHWKIENSKGAIENIDGVGVVGEQPIIYSGEDFSYTSATEIDTPNGKMYGKYTMETDYGERFETEIPQFNLTMPRNLH